MILASSRQKCFLSDRTEEVFLTVLLQYAPSGPAVNTTEPTVNRDD